VAEANASPYPKPRRFVRISVHKEFLMPHPFKSGKWLILSAICLAPLLLLAADKEGEPEAAIRASIKSYVEAYNHGDYKAVADHWSDQGEWVSPDGEKFTGKEAITEALKAQFEANHGDKIEVTDPTIRLVTADVAIEEGTVVVFSPGEAPSKATYIAVHVKKDGKWKLDSVRETEIAEAPAQSPELEELSWLVGDWVDAESGGESVSKVTWTKNKAFLNYSFAVSFPGMDDLEGNQVIGWDPAAGTIRSWMFDSDGGFGDGVWTRKGESWVVKFSQVLSDGRTATATNVYTRVDDNTYKWKSIGRTVDGEMQPNVEEVKIVRQGTQQEEKQETLEESKPVTADSAEKTPE
jgi:uncharacterized protein (TIGR02246 family)